MEIVQNLFSRDVKICPGAKKTGAVERRKPNHNISLNGVELPAQRRRQRESFAKCKLALKTFVTRGILVSFKTMLYAYAYD